LVKYQNTQSVILNRKVKSTIQGNCQVNAAIPGAFGAAS